MKHPRPLLSGFLLLSMGASPLVRSTLTTLPTLSGKIPRPPSFALIRTVTLASAASFAAYDSVSGATATTTPSPTPTTTTDTVTIFTPANGNLVDKAGFLMTGSGNTSNGVRRIEFQVNNGKWRQATVDQVSHTWSAKVPKVKKGKLIIRVRVIDAAGGVSKPTILRLKAA